MDKNQQDQEQEPVFVTDDQAVHKPGNLDPDDQAIIADAAAGRGIPITSMEQLNAIAKGLVAAYEGCLEVCRKKMTQEQASFIRHLRVDEGYSWRAVAAECHKQNWWGADIYWDRVPSAQPMGMALCEVAAGFFNEDYEEPPWN